MKAEIAARRVRLVLYLLRKLVVVDVLVSVAVAGVVLVGEITRTSQPLLVAQKVLVLAILVFLSGGFLLSLFVYVRLNPKDIVLFFNSGNRMAGIAARLYVTLLVVLLPLALLLSGLPR